MILKTGKNSMLFISQKNKQRFEISIIVEFIQYDKLTGEIWGEVIRN